MYSNPSFKNIFFTLVGLFIISLGIFLYFFIDKIDIGYSTPILIIAGVSFIINVITILGIDRQGNSKIWGLLIFILLYTSALYELPSLNIMVAYFLLSIALLLILDTFTIPSTLKYFNIGMITAVASFVYFPILIFIILFLIFTLVSYDERINISQYLGGIVVTVILIVEIIYLSNSVPYLIQWYTNFHTSDFQYKLQIPILIILVTIFIYGLVLQYSNKKIKENNKIAERHSILVFYLLTWILVYALFLGNNYSLLVFVSMPISLIVSRVF